MEITYVELEECVQKFVGGICLAIPKDDGNRDYQEYLKWLSEQKAGE